MVESKQYGAYYVQVSCAMLCHCDKDLHNIITVFNICRSPTKKLLLSLSS